MALGLIVIKAAQAARAGKNILEVKSVIEETIPRAYAYAKLDTIDYLLRGGRMSSIQQTIVGLLGIKPILRMNNHISKMEVARTRSKAFERVLNVALDCAPQAELFGITHAHAPEQVEELIQKLKAEVPDFPEPMVSEVTPALGAHVGPGALCINGIDGLDNFSREKKGIRLWIS